MRQIVFCHFGIFFALLSPLKPQKWKFQKNENMPGDKIFLHKCTSYHDHMLYCSWDMVCNRCNCCFSFWAAFYPFTPLTAQEMKTSQKWRKAPGDIIILHMCIKNHDMLYCSWDMARDGCNCYFSFWAIFCPSTLPP